MVREKHKRRSLSSYCFVRYDLFLESGFKMKLKKISKSMLSLLMVFCLSFVLCSCVSKTETANGITSSLSETSQLTESSEESSSEISSQVSSVASESSKTESSKEESSQSESSKETPTSNTDKNSSSNSKGDTSSNSNKHSSGQSNSNSSSSSTASKPNKTPKPETSTPDPKPAKKTCYLTIDCKTILNRMDDLTPGKESFVPKDGYILKKTAVTFEEGENVFDVLLRETKARKIHMEHEFFPIYKSEYIEGINQLYEFDCGAGSGWMYYVNGGKPDYGVSKYTLKDGDDIQIRYTCDLGNDLK